MKLNNENQSVFKAFGAFIQNCGDAVYEQKYAIFNLNLVCINQLPKNWGGVPYKLFHLGLE